MLSVSKIKYFSLGFISSGENVSASRKKNKRKKRGKQQNDLRRSSGESDGQQCPVNGQMQDDTGSELAVASEISKISPTQVMNIQFTIWPFCILIDHLN
jgi:hypothetical protein